MGFGGILYYDSNCLINPIKHNVLISFTEDVHFKQIEMCQKFILQTSDPMKTLKQSTKLFQVSS